MTGNEGRKAERYRRAGVGHSTQPRASEGSGLLGKILQNKEVGSAEREGRPEARQHGMSGAPGSRLGAPRGGAGRQMESSIETYTLPRVEQIARERLLCNTGRSAQRSVITRGVESGGGWAKRSRGRGRMYTHCRLGRKQRI